MTRARYCWLPRAYCRENGQERKKNIESRKPMAGPMLHSKNACVDDHRAGHALWWEPWPWLTSWLRRILVLVDFYPHVKRTGGNNVFEPKNFCQSAISVGDRGPHAYSALPRTRCVNRFTKMLINALLLVVEDRARRAQNVPHPRRGES
jgi:hypothetical protein